jgi:hypothetical protein
MKSRTTHHFQQLFADLPRLVQAEARDAYRLFRKDPSHPGLHFEQVHHNPPTYSARIGLGHRAVGVLDGGTVVWTWIGSHADYDHFLARL